MKNIISSDLKTILHSKRANLYYLEHCRVLVNGGRVEYVTDEGNQSLYWNIPIANTTTILLGTGTSVTQAAMRELSKAGVMVGFCGGGGTPLYSSIEAIWIFSGFPPRASIVQLNICNHGFICGYVMKKDWLLRKDFLSYVLIL
jgi:CRISPR-associated protein Cas1